MIYNSFYSHNYRHLANSPTIKLKCYKVVPDVLFDYTDYRMNFRRGKSFKGTIPFDS